MEPSSRACSSSGALRTVTPGNRIGLASAVNATLIRTITTIMAEINATETTGTTTTGTGVIARGVTFIITMTAAEDTTETTPPRGGETQGTALERDGGSAFRNQL